MAPRPASATWLTRRRRYLRAFWSREGTQTLICNSHVEASTNHYLDSNTAMNIDLATVRFLNAYAGVSRGFDITMVSIASNGLLKAGPLLVAVWALWFARDPARRQAQRATLISVIAAACCAAAASVTLTHFLPLRPRPLIDPRLDFVMPIEMTAEGWDRASSMPSDHAALFFALAGGLFLVSRPWGVFALLHVLLLVALPRAYLGLHYASDLAAGAALGLVFVWIATKPALTGISKRLVSMEVVHPQLFYPAMFVLSYEIVDLFHEGRGLLSLVARAFTGRW